MITIGCLLPSARNGLFIFGSSAKMFIERCRQSPGIMRYFLRNDGQPDGPLPLLFESSVDQPDPFKLVLISGDQEAALDQVVAE